MAFRRMTERQRDNVARGIVENLYDREGDSYRLKKYENTLIKAARILRDPVAWRHIKTDDVGELTMVERIDLEREQMEVLAEKSRRPLYSRWFLGKGPKFRPKETPEVEIPIRPSSKSFWHTPKELRTTIITLCFAAAIQGWVQAASNGANLTWLVGLGLAGGDSSGCNPQGSTAWKFSVINAAPWFSAAIFALLVADPATELLFGRRAALVMSGVFIFAASIGAGYVQNWQQLLVCRILLGLGCGCKASVVPVFAAEVAPRKIRGSLVMSWQLFDAFGIAAGGTANLIASRLGPESWRWMNVGPALPTLVLLALVLVACPESPRFLMSRGRYFEAYETLSRLRGSRILAAKELVYSYYQIQYEEASGISRSRRPRSTSTESQANGRDIGPRERIWFHQKFIELFTVRRNRNALITAAICMGSQQLCGVNVLVFYSSTIFSDAIGSLCQNQTPESLQGPLLMTWGIGLANFIFTFPAYWLIDNKGRRWLLTRTVPFLCIFATAAAISYVYGPHQAALGVFTYLFIVFYSVGLGPVPFTISAEVFPLDHRVVGMSAAVFINFIGLGILTLVVPEISASSFGHGGLLGIFAFLNIVAFIMIRYLVRETVSASAADDHNSMEPLALEELYKIFDLSTRDVLEGERRWPFGKGKATGNEPDPLWLVWEKKHPEGDVELNEYVQSDDTSERIERVDRRPADDT